MRIAIDLRWMRPGVAGGIENLSRSFLSELLDLNPAGRWTALVPAEVAYDFDTRGREGVRVEAFDRPGRLVARLLGASALGAATRSAFDAALSLSGAIAPDLRAAHHVLVFHDLQHEYHPDFFSPHDLAERRRAVAHALRRADRVIAVSEYTRRTLLDRFALPPDRITTAHQAADRRFHPDRARAGDVPRILAKYDLSPGYVLFPAHTWRHKNHQRAVEALALLRARRGLAPALVLTGTSKEGHPDLLAAAARLGMTDRVRFLGYCPVDEMPALYRGAAALFYPSLFEGFGLPLVEAMWCRCPIVCSRATSLPEVAGDAALLVDPYSAADMADALARVLTEPDLRADLAERGLRRAHDFSWPRFTADLLRTLAEVCAAPPGPDELAQPSLATVTTRPSIGDPAEPTRPSIGDPAEPARRSVGDPESARPSLGDLPAAPPGRRGWPWTDGAPAEAAANEGPWPGISVVTPVHDRAADLEETIRSVLLQGYPRLEYVVVDDGSTDGSAEIIARYRPWLARVESQEHRGTGVALNRGFDGSTGDILASLTPDAILQPGALAAAARAVDPSRGRHVAVGRCSFVDGRGQPIGAEHPSRPADVERVLAVWKGPTIPQPALFWSREAWRACGPLPARGAVHYDLCCRLAARYRFHEVDRILSSYRLSLAATAPLRVARRGLDELIEVSRRHWGSPWGLRYWRLAASLAAFRLDRPRRARAILDRSGMALRRRHRGAAFAQGALACLLGPDVVFMCRVYPALRRLAPTALRRAVARVASPGRPGGDPAPDPHPTASADRPR